MKAIVIMSAAVLSAACTFNLRPGAGAKTTGQHHTVVLAQLYYPERIALPPDAVLHTRIDRVDTDGRRALATYRTALDGSQVPLPLDLGIEHAARIDGLHELRARIYQHNELLRDTGPVLLDLHSERTDLGRLRLYSNEQMLREKAAPDIKLPVRAQGNEPGWLLEIGSDGQAQFTGDYGQSRQALEVIETETEGGITWIHARGGNTAALIAGFHDRLCRDSATGMPYPWTVDVQTLDADLDGCGGQPQSLLAGSEWVIERVGDRPVPEEYEMTLGFDDGGRLFGQSACNRYFADWRLTGERLHIEQPGATMMACPEPQMTLERQFFDLLGNVDRFDFTNTGQLALISADERQILARPAEPASP